MPSVEGIIPRKVLPVFAVMQHFGDDRDNIYRSIMNGLLEKYCSTNEKNADVEAELYFAQYDSESFVETSGLVQMSENINSLELRDADVASYTLSDILSYVAGKMSTSEYLLSEVGFYQPIFYLFLSNIVCDADVINTLRENKWFKYATRLGLPFDNVDDTSEESLLQLTGNPEAIFRIPVSCPNERAREIIDLIYGIRIDSITHSIAVDAVYPQTGMMGAALMRDYIVDSADCVDPHKLSMRQANFAEIVSVDPVEKTDVDIGEPIVLAGALATPEELAIDEVPVEPTDSEENADSNADDWASGSWDD